MLPAFCRLESIILHTNFHINTNGEAPESCIIFSYSTQEMFSGIFYEPALCGVLTIKRTEGAGCQAYAPSLISRTPMEERENRHLPVVLSANTHVYRQAHSHSTK